MTAAIRVVDAEVGTRRDAVMRERIDDSPSAYIQRSSAWRLRGFAGTALLLGVIGLYGVIAYSVGQRTREIGLRLALGAERVAVYRLILGEAGRLIALGIAVGVGAAILAARLMRTLLFNTAPWDAPTLLAVAVLLGRGWRCWQASSRRAARRR